MHPCGALVAPFLRAPATGGALLLDSLWIYTMNRCAQLFLALALAAGAAAPAAAQGTLQRNFPQSALRGNIIFHTPPAITLNGQNLTTAPAFRVHGVDNLLVLTTQLENSKAVINYTTDLEGRIYEAWILSPTEAAKSPWPATRAQAAAWTFDPIAQTWTKP